MVIDGVERGRASSPIVTGAMDDSRHEGDRAEWIDG
jgi:hypothetical protein